MVYGIQEKRMRYLGFVVALLGLPLAANAASAPVCSHVVVTADPAFPPFAWFDGQRLQGASVDVVRLALDRIHLPYTIRYVGPFLRVLQSARLGTVDIVTELKQSPDRDAYLNYVPTPIFSNPTAVFVRAGTVRHFSGRDDLMGQKVGVTLGTRFGPDLDDFIATRLNPDAATSIPDNFRMLAAKRVDYFISPYYPAISYLASEKQEDRFDVLNPFVATVNNYVGWSKKSPCLARLPAFNAALAQIVSTGVVRQKISKNTAIWRDAPMTRQPDLP
jgi:polar amino acid transport system substrate-binding protein